MGEQWGDELRTRLEEAFAESGVHGRLSALEVLEGGRSGLTYAAELSVGNTVERVVVKAAPPGRAAVGRHDMARQAGILEALSEVGAVPTPRVLLRLADDDYHAFVMQRCVGEAFEPVLDSSDLALPGDLVSRRATSAATILAHLHRFDTSSHPVTSAEEVAALDVEVARWTATSETVDPTVAPGIDDLSRVLAASIPSTAQQAVLVHGDFRLGNIVYDGAAPSGVIDWEIWGVTDPGVDLGWFLVFCDPAAFPGIGAEAEGMPSPAKLLEAYQQAGGIVPDDIVWYDAFGRFKMAAIMAHNLRRHREGRHVDPYQEKLVPTIRRLVDTGLQLLQR